MCANQTQKSKNNPMQESDISKNNIRAKITITNADAQDIASIMPIMDSAFDPQYGEAWNSAQCLSMLALPHTDLYLALYDDEICGFAFTRSLYEDVELLMIATHRDYCKKGIASSLIQHIIILAKKHDRERIFLEMREGNSAEILYDIFGFNNVSKRKNYYKGHDNVCYNAITKELLI